MRAIRPLVTSAVRAAWSALAGRSAGRADGRRRGSARAGTAAVAGGAPAIESPGRFGPDATIEVDPGAVGTVAMTYRPQHDGEPDPGEIVWTWVPFEEDDGRGKDRPVLVIAREGGSGDGGPVLAVQLTSRDHGGDGDFVAIGAGSWDGAHRPSWVNLDRIMRVWPGGMRREAAALDRENFGRVEAALRRRYGWR